MANSEMPISKNSWSWRGARMAQRMSNSRPSRSLRATFRRTRKTTSQSAFVGECKIWGGAGQVAGDLDQLLGYLTWRDSKASLIVFNKTVKGFTALQDSLVSAIKGHKCFLNALPCNEAGEWRFSMRSIEDEGRRVTLHVFFFNIYADATGSGPRIRST